eukprot:TRINITY_DN17290_c0_g1_i7.p1 TRINITY_DN17290_c0_g1~~TRINITY_DN17290_c0_g1_i7.p1  ORF type:complete len:434 (+),score=27.25 TRINITY_DN17290_c0_g1_i7:3-1304(+)
MATCAERFGIPYVQLWLHPIHGTLDTELKPLQSTRLQEARSAADRFKETFAFAETVARLPCSSDEQPVQVLCANAGLFVLDSCATRRLWLPLLLSQIVECGETNSLAYAYPTNMEALSWGEGLESMVSFNEASRGEVWILQATRTSNSVARSDVEATRTALKHLGTRGAIQSRMRTLEFEHCLGFGSHATVRLLQSRRARRSSSLTAPDSKTDRYRTRAQTDGNRTDPQQSWPLQHCSTSRTRALAAKVAKDQLSEEVMMKEMVYLLSAQKHPNVLRVMSLSWIQSSTGEPKLAMLMEAHTRDIHAAVATKGSLSGRETLAVAEDVCKALIHIHHLGVIHRDVKPENVVQAADGRAVLLDFGIAVHVSETQRMTEYSGTPGYIAPEILMRLEYGLCSDVFSCGAMLCYCLSGCPKTGRRLKVPWSWLFRHVSA